MTELVKSCDAAGIYFSDLQWILEATMIFCGGFLFGWWWKEDLPPVRKK